MSDSDEAGRSREPGDVADPMVDGGAEGESSGGRGVRMTGRGVVAGTATEGGARESPAWSRMAHWKPQVNPRHSEEVKGEQ